MESSAASATTDPLPRTLRAPVAAGAIAPRPTAVTTEYERLASAFHSALRRHDAFVDAALAFADGLTDAFGDHLACPRSAIAFQPEDADISLVGLRRYVPEEAIKLRDDRWFGFRITIGMGRGHLLSFPISFRPRADGGWVLKLTRTEAESEVAESLDGAEPAFRAWVELATSGLAGLIDEALRGSTTVPFDVGFSEGE